MVEGHHEPYVSAAEWDEVQTRLRHNRRGFRQPAGAGPALCQGLIRCGKCGRSMSTIYYPTKGGTGITYTCNLASNQLGAPLCWSVDGRRLDAVVARELLASLTAPEVDAVVAASAEVNAGYDAACRQWQAELDRVRYEADLARRRYEAVDHGHRLAAACVEKDYDLALERLQQVELAQAEALLVPPLELTPEVLSAIQRLSTHLSEVWNAPSTAPQDRKLLVRLFIQEVRVVSVSPMQFEVDIVWIGGAVSRHVILRQRASAVLARELAARGLTLAQIATELNRRGFRTRIHGNPYTPPAVRALLRWGLPRKLRPREPWLSHRESLRPHFTELIEAGLKDEGIADELNRRGLRPFHREVWNVPMIRHLRLALGLARFRLGNMEKSRSGGTG